MLGPKRHLIKGYTAQRVKIHSGGHYSRASRRWIKGLNKSYYKVRCGDEVFDTALTMDAARRRAKEHAKAKSRAS